MRVDVLDLIRLERQIVEAAHQLAAEARRRVLADEGHDLERAVAALMQAKAVLGAELQRRMHHCMACDIRFQAESGLPARCPGCGRWQPVVPIGDRGVRAA